MLRDRNLVPFSHQHQHALALCVRIERALTSGDTAFRRWQAEIHQAFESEIELHFEAEEQFLFPMAARRQQLRSLVSELLAEHTMLRSYNLAAVAQSLNSSELLDFAAALSSHIRKEERELFQQCQDLFPPDELALVGQNVEAFFRSNDVGSGSTEETDI